MVCVNYYAMSNTEWKTIRVPVDVYEDAKERKEEHGVTWGEYVNPHAWHSVFDEPSGVPEGLAKVADATEDELAAIRSSVETVEQRTGSIERALEDLQR